MTEEAKKVRRSRYPLGHEAAEMDIANAVFYLGTDLSNSTTGIDLLIDSLYSPENGGIICLNLKKYLPLA